MAAAALMIAGCLPSGQQSPAPERKIRIGFSMDTLQEERWQRDRDLFVSRARELGADVFVQAAAGDDYLQMSQAENMLARGVDVLVVVPHDAGKMGQVVEKAHAAGVKVIAYDRLITYADVDFYISFDSERIGELQAQYLTRRLPNGNYVYIGGAPTDNNAYLLQRGVQKVLEPLQSAGGVKVVYSEMTPEWRPETARQLMEAALKQTGGKVDTVIAANDALAGGAIQALYQAGLAGKVLVAGQDADLAALRRIVDGTQTMTVYKPIKQLAAMAAEAAVAMARGGAPLQNGAVSNGKKAVPAYMLQPVAVDRENWVQTVVKDGFHREEEVLGIK